MADEVENKDCSIIEKILGDVDKTAAAKQFFMGSISGWGTGYIAMKVGRITAFAVGGGIILLQIANHNGYIEVNWNKINKNIRKITEKVEEGVIREAPSMKEKMYKYISTNTYLSTGYIAGLLIGIAYS